MISASVEVGVMLGGGLPRIEVFLPEYDWTKELPVTVKYTMSPGVEHSNLFSFSFTLIRGSSEANIQVWTDVL